MVKDVFNNRDKVTSFDVAKALLESINSFSGKCIQSDKSRHSYFGTINRDELGDSWDVSIYKLPKVLSPFTFKNMRDGGKPLPVKDAAQIYCSDDGKVFMDMGGEPNGYEEGDHMELYIKTKGALEKFLSKFHQTHMIHIADIEDREYMGADFGRNKRVPGLKHMR